VSRPMPTEPLAAVPSAPEPAVSGAKGEVRTVELTRAQRTVARRMAESKATIPDFHVSVEADVTELLAALPETVTLDDAVIKAAALALRDHPRTNGAYADAAFQLHSRINIGVAVGGPDTLVAPTVFDADAKPVATIAEERRALAAKVEDNTIASPELSGGTFTVASLSAFGVRSFTAVITPGQAAILATGAPVQRMVLDASSTLVSRQLLTLTLSADHRILYGADAAAFLATVRERLERGAELLG
jgi:pyruvate dehydrogenase E2 component (dihydrolipoamide acetyltransferase)